MYRILLLNTLFFIFGTFQGHAQTVTDSLTKLIEKEKDVAQKSVLYLKRAKTYPPPLKEKAFNDIENAKKFYTTQNDPQGLVDVDLALADHYFMLRNVALAFKTDSIALHTATKINYNKAIARAHGNLGRDYMAMQNVQKANLYIKDAIALFENLEPTDYESLAGLYNQLSIISSRDAKVDQSLAYIEKAIELAEKTQNETLLTGLYLNSAIAYNKLSKYERSIQNNLKAMQLAQKAHNKRQLAQIHNNLAITYRHLKEYDKAIFYHKEGIVLAQQTQNYKSLGMAYMNLATVYNLNNQSTNLDSLYTKAAQSFKKVNDLHGVARVYHNYANYLSKKGQANLDTLYTQSLAYFTKANDTEGQAMTHQDYGTYLLKKGSLTTSEKHLLQALTFRKKQASPPRTAALLSTLGNLMIDKNDLLQAENFLLEAKELSKEVKDKSTLNDINTSLKRLYTIKEEYELALAYQKEEIELIRESFNENEKIGALKAQADYDLLVKEQAHEQAKQKQAKRQFYINSAIAFVILILLMVLILLWQRRKRIKQKHRSQIIQMEQKHQIHLADSLAKTEQNERKKIAQKLHDETVGTLSIAKLNVEQLSDSLFTANSDAEKKLHTAKNLLNQVSDSIRDISHTLMPVALEKYGLKKGIEDLIFSINTSKTVRIEYVIDGLENTSLWDDQLNLTIYRMVQEVFNNILKHAEATHVFVQIIEFDDSVSIYIEDNGKGIKAFEKDSNGMGLHLLKQNIAYFNGKIEVNGQENKGTLVLAELPIRIKKHT